MRHTVISRYTERRPCLLHDAPGTPPAFVVAGVRGGGTTSLYGSLVAHEQVYAATCKEIGFLNGLAARAPTGGGASNWYTIVQAHIYTYARPSLTVTRRCDGATVVGTFDRDSSLFRCDRLTT
jgi:hypothetical protein